MIAFVRGNVAALTLSSAVVEVGGVGLELMCTPGTIAQLRTGRQATLPTSMVVREDSLTLYGFADEEEKAIFELVQTASGVGPKVAQSIIAVLSPDGVRTAIAGEDVKTLTKVPGIGQKGAQRIILELKDRIGAPGSENLVARKQADWDGDKVPWQLRRFGKRNRLTRDSRNGAKRKHDYPFPRCEGHNAKDASQRGHVQRSALKCDRDCDGSECPPVCHGVFPAQDVMVTTGVPEVQNLGECESHERDGNGPVEVRAGLVQSPQKCRDCNGGNQHGVDGYSGEE